MTNKFHNVSNEMLADMIGDASKTVKEEEAYLDSLKDEAKSRGVEQATGARFRFDITEEESSRLDVKGLRELLGDALDPYSKKSVRRVLRVKAVFEQPALVD